MLPFASAYQRMLGLSAGASRPGQRLGKSTTPRKDVEIDELLSPESQQLEEDDGEIEIQLQAVNRRKTYDDLPAAQEDDDMLVVDEAIISPRYEPEPMDLDIIVQQHSRVSEPEDDSDQQQPKRSASPVDKHRGSKESQYPIDSSADMDQGPSNRIVIPPPKLPPSKRTSRSLENIGPLPDIGYLGRDKKGKHRARYHSTGAIKKSERKSQRKDSIEWKPRKGQKGSRDRGVDRVGPRKEREDTPYQRSTSSEDRYSENQNQPSPSQYTRRNIQKSATGAEPKSE